MKKLTLLRHAKSSWDDPDLADHDRDLNNRGRRDAPEMGRRLFGLGLVPDSVLCSSAVRTLATARLLLPELSVPQSSLVIDSELYEATPGDIFECIHRAPDNIEHLMVIAHNPGLAMLASLLNDYQSLHFPTCAVSIFEIDSTDWQIDPHTTAQLLHHDFPKSNL